MNLQNTLWVNYNFWFKVSLIAILTWLIVSLIASLVLYFSWPYYVRGIEIMIFKFLTWFFLLPAIGLFGLINAVPFISVWLFEDVPDNVPVAPLGMNNLLMPNAVNNRTSYKNVASKLEELYDDEDLF